MEDTAYLARAGDVTLINADSSGLMFDGPNGGFVHAWELFNANIEYGRELVDNAIVKFGSVLPPEEVAAAQAVMSDPFLKSRLLLKPSKMYFDLALHEYRENWRKGVVPSYTPWAYLGLYYFNRVYVGEARRPGDFIDFLAFERKVRRLAMLSRDGPHPTPLFRQ